MRERHGIPSFDVAARTLVTQEVRSPLSEAWDKRSTSETGEASGDGSMPLALLLALSMIRRNGPPDGTSGGSLAVVSLPAPSAASCL